MAVNPVMVIGGIALVGWLASMAAGKAEAAPAEQPPEQPPTPGEPSARLSSESIEVSID